MGDGDDRLALHHAGQLVLYLRFHFGIQRARRFVEYEDRSILE